METKEKDVTTTSADEVEEVDAEETSSESSDEQEQEEASHIDNKNDEEEDLKAQLEAERKLRQSAEDKILKQQEAMARERFKKSEQSDDEDKPLTANELEARLALEREENVKTLRETQAAEIANRLGRTDTERELILTRWRNRPFAPGMSLEEQMEEVYVLTHKKKILGENSELRRALAGREAANKDASGTRRVGQKSGKEGDAPSDVKGSLQRRGFTYNETNRRYEKKIGRGRVMVWTEDGGVKVLPQ